MAVAEIYGFHEDVCLDFVEQLLHVLHDAFYLDGLLLQGVAAHYLDGAVFQVARTKHKAYRNALQFVVGEFETRTFVLGVVVFHTDTQLLQTFCDFGCLAVQGGQLLVGFPNRNNHHLDWGEGRRKHKAVVVGVGHDQRAHQSGAHTPRSGPGIFWLVLFVEERHFERLAEVLAQEVGRAALKGFAVLHHGLYRVGVEGTGKSLGLTLHTLNHWNCHVFLGKLCINLQHQLSTLLCLFFRGMGSVSFLPEKLCCAQEQAGTHLPAHHVAPLVAQDWQVAVGFDPVLIGVPDNSL